MVETVSNFEKNVLSFFIRYFLQIYKLLNASVQLGIREIPYYTLVGLGNCVLYYLHITFPQLINKNFYIYLRDKFMEFMNKVKKFSRI